MATIKIMGQAKVKSIKARFKKDIGVDIEIYDQKGNPAPDDVTLGSIRTKSPKSTELKIVGQSKVKTVETYFENNYGVKIDILNPDGGLTDNDATLGETKRLYSDTYMISEVNESVDLEKTETEKEDIMDSKHKNDSMSLDADRVKEFEGRLSEAEDFQDFCFIADEIAQENDKDWAREIYKKALEKAEDCDDFTGIADSVVVEDQEKYIKKLKIGQEKYIKKL